MQKRFTQALSQKKLQFLQKVGAVGKSVDQTFEEQRKNWERMNKLVAKIDQDLRKQKKLETLHVPFAALAEGASAFFEQSDSVDDQKTATAVKQAAQDIGDVVQAYMAQQDTVRSNLQEYMKTLAALKPRIRERDQLQADYETWKKTVKGYQEKPPKDFNKITTAEQNLNNYKELYEGANESLTFELAELYENRFQDFEATYKLLVQSQYQLFTKLNQIFMHLKEISTAANASSASSIFSPTPASSSPSSLERVPSSPTPGSPEPQGRRALPAKPTTPDTPEETEFRAAVSKLDEELSTREKDWAVKESQTRQQLSSLRSQAPGQSSLRVKAQFDFDATEPGELSFKENDVITVVKKFEDSDWWKGELNGKTGVFPSNYTEVLADTSSSAADRQRTESEIARLEGLLRSIDQERAQARGQRETRVKALEAQKLQKVSDRLKREEQERMQRDRAEAERKRADEERKKLEEERKKQEEERKRLQAEQQRREEQERRAQEERQRKEQEEARKRKEAEDKSKTQERKVLVANFSYDAQEPNEISFREGDRLTLVKQFEDSDWWQVELNGRIGLAPGNFFTVSTATNSTAPALLPSSSPSSPPSFPSAQARPRVLALYDHPAAESNELSFVEGDVITVVEKPPNSDWWLGELKGKVGLFPSNFTQPV